MAMCAGIPKNCDYGPRTTDHGLRTTDHGLSSKEEENNEIQFCEVSFCCGYYPLHVVRSFGAGEQTTEDPAQHRGIRERFARKRDDSSGLLEQRKKPGRGAVCDRLWTPRLAAGVRRYRQVRQDDQGQGLSAWEELLGDAGHRYAVVLGGGTRSR